MFRFKIGKQLLLAQENKTTPSISTPTIPEQVYKHWEKQQSFYYLTLNLK